MLLCKYVSPDAQFMDTSIQVVLKHGALTVFVFYDVSELSLLKYLDNVQAHSFALRTL